MSKNKNSLPVIFRKFPNRAGVPAEVIALFPTLPGTNDASTCANYMHIGQHGAALADVGRTVPAKPEDYAALLAELRSIGYTDLRVMSRITAQHHAARRHALNLARLDEFTRHYLIAALWSEHGPEDADYEFLDSRYGLEDIAPAALVQAMEDCRRFQSDNAALLSVAYGRYKAANNDEYSPEARAGHDFLLTRNHHGAGFWDRSELDQGGIGEALTKAAHAFGEVCFYVGDDGRIYQ